MTVPLAVLAVLAVLGGVLGLPAVLHVPHLMHGWLEPVVAPGARLLEAHGHAAHPSHALEWVLLAFGAGVALFFAHKGFHAFKDGPERDERLARARPELFGFLGRAWGVDAAYSTNVVQPTKLLAFVTAVVVDQFAIDGMVNGTATLARGAGERLRRLADGRIVTYALWIGGGAVVLVLLLMGL
jgi:NADH-quinone oxidoreductase subunit L